MRRFAFLLLFLTLAGPLSAQSVFLDYDNHIVESRVGAERAKSSYCWKTLMDRGVSVSNGSDCPVELPDGTTREIDMFYLASNFDVIFDPAPLFALDAKGVCDNDLGITDAGLFELALEMNKTESDDLLGYMKKWIAFEERFNQTLPMLPIYTNVYFDFYPLELHNYNIDETVTWGQAILDSWIGEQPEQEPEATTSPAPGEVEGDEEEFETFE